MYQKLSKSVRMCKNIYLMEFLRKNSEIFGNYVEFFFSKY
jgi:hypothetical protein